jgi:REP element-mobilizing transposase RayT
MARVLRTSLPDGYFHVYARGVAGVPPFPAPQDRTALLALLLKGERRFDLRVDAACVMTTHYHAVVEATQSALSCAMQWLNARYARAFNTRYGRFGHVFAERFQTRVIDGEDRVFETCAYVLLNPVKAGLCDRVEDWPWSFSRYGLDVT